MGTYHIIMNESKAEYLSPHDMGQGAKIREIELPSKVAIATAILLANEHYEHPRAGTWDEAIIVDDETYADKYYHIKNTYTNISIEMLNFIDGNNIGEEDWMEDVLDEKCRELKSWELIHRKI